MNQNYQTDLRAVGVDVGAADDDDLDSLPDLETPPLTPREVVAMSPPRLVATPTRGDARRRHDEEIRAGDPREVGLRVPLRLVRRHYDWFVPRPLHAARVRCSDPFGWGCVRLVGVRERICRNCIRQRIDLVRRRLMREYLGEWWREYLGEWW